MNIFKSMKYAVVLTMLLLFTICTAVFLPTASTAYLAKTAFTDVVAGTSTFAVSFAGGMQTTDEIQVWVNGAENTSASVVWLSGSTLQLVGYSTAAGDNIEFRRVSPKTDNLVDLEAGKTIRASSLMKNFRHVLQIGQEAVDAASDMITIADDSVDAAIQAAVEAAASASIVDPEKHLYRVANMFTLGSTPATTYTAVYLEGHTTRGDGGQGTFIWDEDSTATDNNGTIRAVTGIEPGRWIRQYTGAVSVGWFGPDGVDDSVAIQAAWDFVKTGNTQLSLGSKTYTCLTAIDFRTNYTSNDHNHRIIGKGTILDFSGTSITSGDLVKFGAVSNTQVNENSKYIIDGLRIVGPHTVRPDVSDTPETSLVGLNVENALGFTPTDVIVDLCYIGLKTKFTFPISANGITTAGCHIGLFQTDDCTLGTWTACQFKNGRFGVVAQPSVNTKTVYGQTFIRPNFEGNKVGIVLDPLDGSGFGIHDFNFIDPYLETVVYDGIRVGRACDLSDASVAGADRSRNVFNIRASGGLWDGEWGQSGHQPILFHAADTSDAPAGCIINIPVDLSVCELGYSRKSAISSTIGLFQGAGANVNLPAVQETGVWTPGISFDNLSVGVTYTVQNGRYVKLGNMVSFTGQVQLTSKGSSTGVFRITGLPFASQVTVPGYACINYTGNIVSSFPPGALVAANSTTISLNAYSAATGDTTQLTNTQVMDTTNLYFSGFYYTEF